MMKRKSTLKPSAKSKKKLSSSHLRTSLPTRGAVPKICILGKAGEPVSIGRLERFLADWERTTVSQLREKAKPTGKRVAIVGAGPAGLTAAADLIKLGHEVAHV